MASIDLRRDLKYVYAWNYYTMNIMGTWPNERKWNEMSSYVVLIPISMMACFICAPQTANLFFIWNDFDLVVENLSMGNITITISLVKTIAFWFNGRELKFLLTCMAEDWKRATRKEDRKRMLQIAKITRLIVIRSTLLCNSVVLFFLVLRYLTDNDGTNTLIFRAIYPYDINVSPSYESTILGQLVATVYAATTYSAVDTFVAMLVLHVCGQISNLQHELTSLKALSRIEFQTKLRNIVRKHNYLNWFAQKIEACFNVMLLIQMLGCTVQLCIQCFQAITSLHGETNEVLILQFLFLLLYVIYVMLQLYLYCYVGERLAVESIKVAHAAYHCEWYNLPAGEAKLLIIIMCRARLPLRITAGKFCSFTIELYTQVIKTSMSYLSVLYAMKG